MTTRCCALAAGAANRATTTPTSTLAHPARTARRTVAIGVPGSGTAHLEAEDRASPLGEPHPQSRARSLQEDPVPARAATAARDAVAEGVAAADTRSQGQRAMARPPRAAIARGARRLAGRQRGDLVADANRDDALRLRVQPGRADPRPADVGRGAGRCNQRGGRRGDESQDGSTHGGVIPACTAGAFDPSARQAPAGAFLQSGRPDLNRGPHRPERCALPGCATPRSAASIDRAYGRPSPATAV